ncbi:hypothetical protein AVEN_10558-1 [Araneus ventricosus]|uniref:Uncharacterized protein n=1 Tax=Araneus ventricosus TaxID=182803 RepID=A0A4Y2Q6G1_ARAVE|nr:hypothetical protein AVEN_10558-1 [Araneus ventricosus]
MNYATFTQESMEDETMADRLIFSDESTFHISGKVNRYNSRIWGTEKPSTVIEHERDSAKVNVFCAISSRKLYGPFFFSERSVTSNVYLDMGEVIKILYRRDECQTSWLMSENSETKPGAEKPGPGTKHWEEISLGDLLPSKFDHPHLPMFLQNVETDLETLEQPSDYWNRTPLLCKVQPQGLV